MGIFQDLFGGGLPPIPKERRPEVDRLIDELITIGKKEDYLSETRGGAFNMDFRNIRARAIGQRLYDIGGMPLMQAAHRRVRKKLGANLTAHLEYAWADIGGWVP